MRNEHKRIVDICRNLAFSQSVCTTDCPPVDWGYLLNLCLEHKVFLHVYPYLKPCIPPEWAKRYEMHFLHQKTYNMKAFQQLKTILDLFNRHSIMYVLSKGFVFSFLIYGNPFQRLSSDADIFVSTEDYIRAVKVLEDAGYEEETYLTVHPFFPCEDKNSYYSANSAGNLFIKKGWIPIELKDQISTFLPEDAERALRNRTSFVIKDTTVYSFSVEDVFVNLVLNTYKNLCCPYGIDHDHRLCDIVDFYSFCVKYKHILTEDSIRSLNTGYQYRITYIARLLKEFYREEQLALLPAVLFDLPCMTPDPDCVIWDIDIFERFFDPQKRRYLHNLFRKRNYTCNNIQPCIAIKPLNHSGSECDAAYLPISFSNGIRHFFRNEIRYLVEYSEQKIYVSFIIPCEYAHIEIALRIADRDTEKITMEALAEIKDLEVMRVSGVTTEDVYRKENCNCVTVVYDKEDAIFDIQGKRNVFLRIEMFVKMNKEVIKLFSIGDPYNLQRYEFAS